MASKHLSNYSIPQDFNAILATFTREILRDQPKDVLEYAAEYFEAIRDNRERHYESESNVPNPNPKSHYTPQPPSHKVAGQQQQQKSHTSLQNNPHLQSEASLFSEISNKEDKSLVRSYLDQLENDLVAESLTQPLKTDEDIEVPTSESHRAEEQSSHADIESANHKFASLANGERLAYLEAGEQNEKVVILLHSNLGSSEIWNELMPLLSGEYRTIALDFRGSGRSTYHTKLHHMRDLADDVVQFMETLDIASASFIGHYTGAAVAMTIGFRYTYKSEKLVLIAPLSIKGHIEDDIDHLKDPKPEDFAQNEAVASIRDALANGINRYFEVSMATSLFSGNVPTDQRLKPVIEDVVKSRNYLDMLYIMSRFNISDDPNGIVDGNGGINVIESDVLILHGMDDRVTPLEVSKAIQDAMGPKTEFIPIMDGAHALMDTNLDEVAEHIRGFLMKPPSHHKYVKLPNGEILSYLESGIYNQKVLIFLHDNLASSESWSTLFPKLEDDYHVIALDLRGFGRSTYQSRVTGVSDFVNDLEEFMKATSLDCATLCGQSMGAAIAILMSIKHPHRVEKLALINPVSPKGSVLKVENVENPQPADYLQIEVVNEINQALQKRNKEFFLKEMMKNRDEKSLSHDMIETLAEETLESRAYLDALYLLARFNLSDKSNGLVEGTGELKNLSVRVLIIQGESDIAAKSATQTIADTLEAKATVKTLQGAKEVFIEMHQDQIAEMLTHFVISSDEGKT